MASEPAKMSPPVHVMPSSTMGADPTLPRSCVSTHAAASPNVARKAVSAAHEEVQSANAELSHLKATHADNDTLYVTMSLPPW
jgi:hypothetical protein